MSSRRASLAALLSLAVLAVGACGSSPTPSPIADAKEILVKSLEATQAAKTVHLKLELAGKVPFDLAGLLGSLGGIPGASGAPLPLPSTGPSASAASLDLTGTTAEGDVDLARSAAHIGFVVPPLLGLNGDLIAVDKAAYLKVSLLGEKYQRLDQGSASGASPSPQASPSPTAGALDAFRAELDKLKTPPKKLADERCGDTDCYHVQLTFDQSSAGPLESLAPGMTGSGTADVFVRKSDLRPAQIVLKGDSGQAAGLTATVNLSGWDSDVSIAAPPADQIGEGGFGLPSFAIPSLPGASGQP